MILSKFSGFLRIVDFSAAGAAIPTIPAAFIYVENTSKIYHHPSKNRKEIVNLNIQPEQLVLVEVE